LNLFLLFLSQSYVLDPYFLDAVLDALNVVELLDLVSDKLVELFGKRAGIHDLLCEEIFGPLLEGGNCNLLTLLGVLSAA
jgi:hypothetical protein